jgi:hypothetical protein
MSQNKLFKTILTGLLLLLPVLSVHADIVRPDTTGTVGQNTSLVVINGSPAISYFDVTNGNLKYVRATDASGTAWGTPISIDTAGNVGQYTSLAVVNGNPAISYFDVTNGDLKYVRATDANGTAWGAPISIDTAGIVGRYTSLAVVNGNPAISYFDVTNFDLKYVRATDASGTAWGAPISIDTVGNVGQYTSLAVVNGNPAISYFDLTNFDLKYVRATDANGTAWGAPIGVDTAGNVGEYTSLEVVNGSPAISYHDSSNGDLKYVRATNANGTAWGVPIGVDTAGNVGWQTSLEVVNGNPAITYHAASISDLKYVRATDASGTTWGVSLSVDSSPGVVGFYSSLIVVNGNPAISYQDVSNADLKYARACEVNGITWGQCSITLEFASATSSDAEAASFGNLLRVTTSDGNPTAAAVTVTVNVTGGTATAADYNLTGTITIPAATSHNSLVSIASGITVVNDILVEGSETVVLQLSAPVGALLGTQTDTTHTIVDDDIVVITPTSTSGATGGAAAATPQIQVFDPAISKLGVLLPGQSGLQGEQVQWFITVSNIGGLAGRNVVVTDTLNANLRIDRVETSEGRVSVVGQTVTVTFDTIQPGQTFQFSIFTTVTAGATIENTACVQVPEIAPECITVPVIVSLPATGEPPIRLLLLRGIVGVILGSSALFLFYRRVVLKIAHN